MNDEEKCLVLEAMEKCQCKWCKNFRESEDFYLNMIIKKEKERIIKEDLK